MSRERLIAILFEQLCAYGNAKYDIPFLEVCERIADIIIAAQHRADVEANDE